MTETSSAQQIWNNEYPDLTQDYELIKNAILDAERNGLKSTDAYAQANVYRLQLEYAINQHIDAAYENVELNDMYQQYKDEKHYYDDISYNGIHYHNIGDSLELDITHWRGMYYYIDQKIVEFLDEFSADYAAAASFVFDHLLNPTTWLKVPKITSQDGIYDDMAQAHF